MSDQEEEYEVEFIIGKRKKKGKIQYLVKWKGWDRPEDNSWKYLKDLHCNDLIEDFNATAEAKAKAAAKARAVAAKAAAPKKGNAKCKGKNVNDRVV